MTNIVIEITFVLSWNVCLGLAEEGLQGEAEAWHAGQIPWDGRLVQQESGRQVNNIKDLNGRSVKQGLWLQDSQSSSKMEGYSIKDLDDRLVLLELRWQVSPPWIKMTG